MEFDRFGSWSVIGFHVDSITNLIDHAQITLIKNRSLDYLFETVNATLQLSRNVLVLHEGTIHNAYSRCTSAGITALQNVSVSEFLPIYAQCPDLVGVSAESFAAHARRTWPPGGDGGRVVKRSRRG